MGPKILYESTDPRFLSDLQHPDPLDHGMTAPHSASNVLVCKKFHICVRSSEHCLVEKPKQNLEPREYLALLLLAQQRMYPSWTVPSLFPAQAWQTSQGKGRGINLSKLLSHSEQEHSVLGGSTCPGRAMLAVVLALLPGERQQICLQQGSHPGHAGLMLCRGPLWPSAVLLVLSLLLCLINADVGIKLYIAQWPDKILLRAGDSLTISCFQNYSNVGFMFWYQQPPGNGLKLIVCTTSWKHNIYEDGYSEAKFAVRRESSDYILMTIKNVTSKDEATYFCAANDHTV